MMPKSAKVNFSHYNSQIACSIALHSTLVKDLETTIYFLVFPEMRLDPRKIQ